MIMAVLGMPKKSATRRGADRPAGYRANISYMVLYG